ncbi:hypothetical protein SAMN04487911_11057 [Arenibacter nanhaiticus]|uniref:Uncharacterized protein n=1 Tax=Arenibacter nanhaiticus TaxID=558155 RepID=A0A1M6G7A5_9FLAO|nr:hypothetical protein [Arenibacter nanhaiticus]SHJ05820.1 hypothetical protein SAMN04487911_11057 [Arenibacter nanhaiticus]
MCRYIFLPCVLFCLAVSLKTTAQTNNDTVVVAKHEIVNRTILEQFEPGMILSKETRIRLKKDRISEAKRRRVFLDSLSISDRKRKKLLRDLTKKPFSNRLLNNLAKTSFKDSEN